MIVLTNNLLYISFVIKIFYLWNAVTIIKDDFWRNYIVALEHKISLEDVKNMEVDNYFRIWDSSQVIDIWKDGKEFKGEIIHWVREVVPFEEKEQIPGRYYYINEKLDSSACREIYTIYYRNISAIPSEEDIPNWRSGFDGVTYMIETKKSAGYKLKIYWAPSSQKDVLEAQLIENFIGKVATIVNARERTKYFEMGIPFISWTNDGAAATTRILPSSEYYRMKAERNRYYKSQKRLKIK